MVITAILFEVSYNLHNFFLSSQTLFSWFVRLSTFPCSFLSRFWACAVSSISGTIIEPDDTFWQDYFINHISYLRDIRLHLVRLLLLLDKNQLFIKSDAHVFVFQVVRLRRWHRHCRATEIILCSLPSASTPPIREGGLIRFVRFFIIDLHRFNWLSGWIRLSNWLIITRNCSPEHHIRVIESVAPLDPLDHKILLYWCTRMLYGSLLSGIIIVILTLL
jgi:hypothetical protein